MKTLTNLAGIALVVSLACVGHAQTSSTRALVGTTITDPSREPSQFVGTVVIEGERITQVGPTDTVRIPEGTERVDLSGKFLIPGLIDAHVHFVGGFSEGFLPSEYDELRDYPRWGITSVFEAASATESFIRAKQVATEAGAVRARYFGVGQSFDANRGALTGDEIRARLDALRSAGVEAVKLFHYSSGRPVYPREVLATFFDESRARSLPVVVHATGRRAAEDALHAGAHALMHGFPDFPFDDEFIGLMRRAGAFYVPTHTGPESRERQPILRENLRRAQEAGIPIVLGSDTFAGPPPVGGPAGPRSHTELVLYVEAGLTAEQALRSATANAARMIGVFDRLGSIEAGKLADLVVLAADPFEDIRHLGEIEAVYVGGVLLQ